VISALFPPSFSFRGFLSYMEIFFESCLIPHLFGLSIDAEKQSLLIMPRPEKEWLYFFLSLDFHAVAYPVSLFQPLTPSRERLDLVPLLNLAGTDLSMIAFPSPSLAVDGLFEPSALPCL